MTAPFSRRSHFDLEAAEPEEPGSIDLTDANPTRCGLSEPFALPVAADYQPEPLGLPVARVVLAGVRGGSGGR